MNVYTNEIDGTAYLVCAENQTCAAAMLEALLRGKNDETPVNSENMRKLDTDVPHVQVLCEIKN